MEIQSIARGEVGWVGACSGRAKVPVGRGLLCDSGMPMELQGSFVSVCRNFHAEKVDDDSGE